MRKLLIVVVAMLGLAAPWANSPALADEPPVQVSLFSRLGVSGYDPVAYFTDGRPLRGAAQFATTYQGYEYRFASAAHLAQFRAAPARYLPQYGGYCAWAVAHGYTAPGNPQNWRVVDGRLYLNFNAEIQRRWEGDIGGFIVSANANWPAVLHR